MPDIQAVIVLVLVVTVIGTAVGWSLIQSTSPRNEDGVIRYQWNTFPGGALVVIERPVAPNNWSRKTYRCSGASVLRLMALAKHYPHKFQGYM